MNDEINRIRDTILADLTFAGSLDTVVQANRAPGAGTPPGGQRRATQAECELLYAAVHRSNNFAIKVSA